MPWQQFVSGGSEFVVNMGLTGSSICPSPVQLAEAVKRGASSLGSSQPDSQVMTINAVKDVASALGELINATKLASGKPIHDPAMNDMKESARVSVKELLFESSSRVRQKKKITHLDII